MRPFLLSPFVFLPRKKYIPLVRTSQWDIRGCNLLVQKQNIARIANAVQCHSLLSGPYDCSVLMFLIVRNVKNFTTSQGLWFEGVLQIYLSLSLSLFVGQVMFALWWCSLRDLVSCQGSFAHLRCFLVFYCLTKFIFLKQICFSIVLLSPKLAHFPKLPTLFG